MAGTETTSGRGNTPLMRQYYKIKERHPGTILLFRMGDFYETFEEDAVTVSEILGITLTKRSKSSVAEVQLAGFPYHAIDNHLPKLIQAGLRVAICEQMEEAKGSGKIVKRDVVEVVTPGIPFRDQLLEPKQSHYLASIHWGAGQRVGVAWLEASTGEFFVHEVDVSRLREVVESVHPAEVIIDKGMASKLMGVPTQDFVLTRQPDWIFSYDFAYETLLQHFGTHSLKGFGVEGMDAGLVAAGAVLYYLTETQKGRVMHIQRIVRYASDAYMVLDLQTRRNLELVASLYDGKPDGSLIQILDETLTPMGGRMLRRWLMKPLCRVDSIRARQDAVEALFRSRNLRQKGRGLLRELGDLERLAAKVSTDRISPRELVGMSHSLKQIPLLESLFAHEKCDTLRQLIDKLMPCISVVEKIDMALSDIPPATIKSGGVIRENYSEELDRLRKMAWSGKDFVAQLQEQESERTGISSLKVGFNKVFGYYLEVTHVHKDKVPDHYIRKQTLVNSERYITPELKECEESILTAEEKIVNLETALLNELRRFVATETASIQRNASLLASLDCYCSFAELATRGGYCRPEVDDSLILHIEEGRHPVVEHAMPVGEAFIPNSIDIDAAERQIYIITGPNMAGKSVVLRQVGLIVLLAQVGSFVPAGSAHIGVVDRIFTRVGASDNLAAGESTFLVEMNETANILHNATARSIILLDEVGRGTSTFDGLSIAWALVEYLHNNKDVAARTLFATHYHELNELADRLERVGNYRIQVQEHNGKLIFLRRLVPGGSDHSYGIEVARMAGLPQRLVDRARQVLQQLENQHLVVGESSASQEQLDEEDTLQEIRYKLSKTHPNRMTPLEALITLSELKDIINKKS